MLTCTLFSTGVVELNEAAEAYHSRKSEVFASWDKYTVGSNSNHPAARRLLCAKC